MINSLIHKYLTNNSLYRSLLFAISVILLIIFIPKKHVFNYDFSKNETWKHEKLIASFDFSIKKSEEQLKKEQEKLEENKTYYFTINPNIYEEAKKEIELFYEKTELTDTLRQSLDLYLLESYSKGVVFTKNTFLIDSNPSITLINQIDNSATNSVYSSLISEHDFQQGITDRIPKNYRESVLQSLGNIIVANVVFDKNLTDQSFDQNIKNLSTHYGLIKRGDLIIDKGQIINAERYSVLQSYKEEYERQIWNTKKQFLLIVGYATIIYLILLLVFVLLKNFKPRIYHNNTEITFVFFNIIVVPLTVYIVILNFPAFLFFIPFCIQPIVLRSFFDEGVAIVSFLATILITALAVPNSFNFIIIQLIAGIITIITNKKFYRRVNLYAAVLKIVLLYQIVYIMSLLIENGTVHAIEEVLKPMGIFLVSGILVFLSFPLIYFFERVFGLMSDLSLLELSDTNHPVLRLLSSKAPGTMQHSFQVANLAEEAAIEVGADPLLVKIGAMYHDIGKIKNPMYFVENQINDFNPHEELLPKESAKIITSHILDGVDLAKKYKIPDRIIDFIRTHHGDSVVYYFYKKQQALFPDEEVDVKQFKYNGSKPYSKETAIVMICDSVEAASRSIKDPSSQKLQTLINKIVEKQLDSGQYDLAEISIREINMIKNVLLKRLLNIYHIRVEYPE